MAKKRAAEIKGMVDGLMPPPPPPKKTRPPKGGAKPDTPLADAPEVAEVVETEPSKKRQKKKVDQVEEKVDKNQEEPKKKKKKADENDDEKKDSNDKNEDEQKKKKKKKTPEEPMETPPSKTPAEKKKKTAPKPKAKPADKEVVEPARAIPKDFVSTPYNPEPNKYVAPDFPICWGNHNRIMHHYGVSAKEASDILIAIAGPHPNAEAFGEKFNGVTGNPAFDEMPAPFTREERERAEDSQLTDELDGESLGDVDLTNGPYDDEVEEPSVAGTQTDSSTSGTSGSRVDQLETQVLEETQVPPSDKTEPNLSKKVGEQPTPLKNEAFGLQNMF